jgi:hypothetical protein
MTFAIKHEYSRALDESHHDPEAEAHAALEALELELTDLAGHLNAGNYRFLKLLAEFDRRGGHVGVGIASCAHWLSWRCGIGLIAAREKVRVARTLEQLPKLSDAMRRGVLSYCKVRAITRVATPENEAVLISVAEAGTVHHVEKVVRHYRRLERTREREAANDCYENRYLQAYVDDDGCVVIRARLAPEQGNQFLKALQAAADVLRDAECDSRESYPVPDAPVDSYAARNADAVALLAETFLTRDGEAPATVAPERQLVTIHVDERVLHDETQDGRCQIEDQVGIPPAALRRIACDASLVRIEEDPDGTPLNVGRKTRAVPTAVRRALQARDNGCRYPECTNSRFVDAHHIVHWADGGPTSLANLVLLCRRHHRFVHDYGFTIAETDSGLEFRRPNGSPVIAVPPLAQVEATQGCTELRKSHEAADVIITPDTADSHWVGDTPDNNWVLRRLLELDELARQKVEQEDRASSFEDDRAGS